MIHLTRLNGQPVLLNSDLIKLIENAPDTVITLVSGEKVLVRETASQILERVVEFRRRILDGLHLNLSGWAMRQTGGADVIQLRELPSESA